MAKLVLLACLAACASAYPAFMQPNNAQCTSDADCPCSYCMNDASKKPPFLCHDPTPGVCCTKDADCPGSYCVNYHGPPPYHCHASPSPDLTLPNNAQCTSDADCPCSYCMNDASKKPPFLCHDPTPGVCCTKDADCPGSYCVNYHGPPPYHCHASPADDEIRAKLAEQGYNIGASSSALQEFLAPAAVRVHRNGQEVPVGSNASGINPADIWQIGKALWGLVNDNQPAENLTDAWAGAVPHGITDWTGLTGWQQYSSEPYSISFVNAVGMTLTQFDWVFSFKHHGAINGTGLYVTEAGASITKAYAFLTEHLNVQVVAFKPLNYGSTGSPMAGLDLQIKLQSAGKFEKTEVGCHVTLKGDGSLTEITCDKGKHHC